MAGTVKTCRVTLNITPTEELDTAAAGIPAASRQIPFGGFNLNTTLTPTTTAQAELHACSEHTCNGSSQSLDLTAIPHRDGTTVNATGKKLVALLLRNPASNTGGITINDHATNGYKLFGDPGSGTPRGRVRLLPGQTIAIAYESGKANAAAAVSGSAKIVEITGTNAEKLQYDFVFGD